MIDPRQTTDPVALTIAGYDPSSGAGITADLAVFAAHGIFATSAITALTVQSTTGVRRVQPVASDFLADTLACLEADLPPSGIKIGMLGDEAQVRAVAIYLRALGRRIPIILDPVLQSSSGATLLSPQGQLRLQDDLLPIVTMITPNASELSLLTALPCQTEGQIRTAAESLALRYSQLAILCTGGDRAKPDDYLLAYGIWTVLEGEHIASSSTHGTGCALSSATLCNLLAGHTLLDAAAAAKAYVAQAITRATPRGAGKGPLNLLWPLTNQPNPAKPNSLLS